MKNEKERKEVNAVDNSKEPNDNREKDRKELNDEDLKEVVGGMMRPVWSC